MTHNMNSNIQTVFLTVALVAASLLFCGTAGAEDDADQSEVEYDLLFVSPRPGNLGRKEKQKLDPVHVTTRADGGKVVFDRHSRTTSDAIDWAIRHARITVILKGEYRLARPIQIRRDRRTLIVAPDAKLAVTSQEPGPKFVGVIEVLWADNCRVFTFGTLEHAGNSQEAVVFDGIRRDGRSGIKGGLLFGASELRNMGSAYSFADTENIHIPLAVASKVTHHFMGFGGAWDMTVGTAVGFNVEGGDSEGELLELNRGNRNIMVDTAIGCAPGVSDEIIDINHSQNLTVNRFLAFFGTGLPGRLGIGHDRYGGPARFSNRAKIQGKLKNKNINIKYYERNYKKVAGYRNNITLPGFPDSLPVLNIKVNLALDFEDGTTRQLIDKSYRYDLGLDLDLAPAAVRLLE